tara:strand:- start:1269 stop:1553 length:285 start_codon:yes stop_codon:yes gene_type:complete
MGIEEALESGDVVVKLESEMVNGEISEMSFGELKKCDVEVLGHTLKFTDQLGIQRYETEDGKFKSTIISEDYDSLTALEVLGNAYGFISSYSKV